jgi:hypothetical protein
MLKMSVRWQLRGEYEGIVERELTALMPPCVAVGSNV